MVQHRLDPNRLNMKPGTFIAKLTQDFVGQQQGVLERSVGTSARVRRHGVRSITWQAGDHGAALEMFVKISLRGQHQHWDCAPIPIR